MSEARFKWAQWIAYLGLGLAVLGTIFLVISGPGHRFGWWSFPTGFGLLRYGAYAGIAAVVVSAVGIVAGRLGRQNRAFLPAITGIIIGLVIAYVPWHWQGLARSVPPIHDITTDLSNPPAFDALVAERGANQNPIAYGGAEVAAQQRGHYTDIRPVETPLEPDAVFGALQEAVDEAGWRVANVDAQNLTIEAVDQTFWFGFQDDIILRVTPTATGSRVDMRSQSRVGRSDIGTNGRRIQGFLAEFEERLAEMNGAG